MEKITVFNIFNSTWNDVSWYIRQQKIESKKIKRNENQEMEITKMNKTLYHLKILFFFYYRHIHTLPFFSFYNIKNYIIII